MSRSSTTNKEPTVAGKKKGNSKNQTAAARADESRTSANAPLECKKTCCNCGTDLKTRGSFEPVKVVSETGKARMKSRCKAGCKTA